MCLGLATQARLRVAASAMESAGLPRQQFVDVPDGTLSAAQGAAYLREQIEVQRAECTTEKKAQARQRFCT